ncbi:MAG: tRNA epoxyqueuosine(34) reductase QueG [Candidatus Hydrogenedens sp.]
MKKYILEDIEKNIEIQKEIKFKINTIAKELGFATWGVAKVKPQNTVYYLREWIQMGCHADMQWFERSVSEREEILKWFPEAKSIIVFAYNYFHHCHNKQIAMYAHGYDYHKVINKKIICISTFLSEIIDGFKFKISVDAGHVHEKTWAIRAGIGWQGKNSLIIHPQLGSWLLLGILAVNIYLIPEQEMNNHCGECNKCIQTCPTGAINKEGYIDCRKCISYHTIENKNEIPLNIQKNIQNTIFGCDICQKICPWNQNTTFSKNEKLCILDEIDVDKISNMKTLEFNTYFGETPLIKSGFNRIKRNIEIYSKNRE